MAFVNHLVEGAPSKAPLDSLEIRRGIKVRNPPFNDDQH